jgi:hypothetical protein
MTKYTKDIVPGEIVSLPNTIVKIFVVAVCDDDSDNLSSSGSWTRIYGFFVDEYSKPTSTYTNCCYTSKSTWIVL